MTSEVVCSGCRQTVAWPTGGVRCDVDWLDRSGKARRVTMTDLQSHCVFHRCPPLGGLDGGPDAGERSVPVGVAGQATTINQDDFRHPEWVLRKLRSQSGQALPDAHQATRDAVMGRVRRVQVDESCPVCGSAECPSYSAGVILPLV